MNATATDRSVLTALMLFALVVAAAFTTGLSMAWQADAPPAALHAGR